MTLPKLVVESFGLTIIEGFLFSIPAFGPYIGGPSEIIRDGENGYLINPEGLDDIKSKIDYVLSNFEVYKKFSDKAFAASKVFYPDKFSSDILDFILLKN